MEIGRRYEHREFLAVDHPDIVNDLNAEDEETKKLLEAPGHEMHCWQTLSNPRAAVEVFTKVMYIFMVGFWIGGAIFGTISANRWIESIPSTIIIVMIPTLLYYTGKLVLRHNLVKDKNNIYLNRRKGIIVVPQKKRPPKEIPFVEFDAYLGTSVNPSGSTSYHLWLGHRTSEIRACAPTDTAERWKIHQEWELWQRYMDISQPLPDTPRFEPFRSRDPVTAAYDKKNHRPSDYWKHMDMNKARMMYDAAYKAASKYPWGMERGQALAYGWQPSGFGERDWRTDRQERQQAVPAGGA